MRRNERLSGIQIILWTGLGLGAGLVAGFTVSEWIGGDRHVLFTVPFGHEQLELTEELLRVSAFLAAFSALYFTVVALTDATYRDEFFRDVVSEVRQALAVRLVYLNARRNTR